MTRNREDLPAAFRGTSDDDKLSSFEASTVRLILSQIGWERQAIQQAASDYGPAFGVDWLNEMSIIRARIGTARALSFRFEDLLLKPSGHEIVEAFRIFKGDSAEPCCLIFHVFDHGRWVATNLATPDDASIHVVTDGGHLKFNVLSFTKFFTNRWSSESP